MTALCELCCVAFFLLCCVALPYHLIDDNTYIDYEICTTVNDVMLTSMIAFIISPAAFTIASDGCCEDNKTCLLTSSSTTNTVLCLHVYSYMPTTCCITDEQDKCTYLHQKHTSSNQYKIHVKIYIESTYKHMSSRQVQDTCKYLHQINI